MKEGKCIQCESDHVIADSVEYSKIQAENRKRIEAQGKRWIPWEERKAMNKAKTNTKQVQLARFHQVRDGIGLQAEISMDVPLVQNFMKLEANVIVALEVYPLDIAALTTQKPKSFIQSKMGL